MEKKLDPDRIRERLNIFLDKYYQIAPSTWAARMGLSHVALFRFLHGATHPQRRTLSIISNFIESFEKDMGVRKKDPEVCEICGNKPQETYFEDWGDGYPHWVCFEHMRSNLEKK